MDDLLKVFLGETTECLTACWGAVERLRKVPGDSAALGDLLHQVRSVQETSKFLGMSALQAAAGLVLESLESASARRPASTDRIVPIAVDGLLRIEAVINAMANSEGELASLAVPPARLAAAPATPSTAAAAAVESIDSVLANGLPPIPAPAPDGTVRINAETLGYLVSTVRGLVDTQAEMMRLLQAKEAERAATATAPAPPKPEKPDKSEKQKVRQPAKSGSSPAASKSATASPKSAESKPVSPRSAQMLGAPPAPGMVRVLLFRGDDGQPKAAYLDQVAGLEEVDLKAVDHSRGLWVMRSGDDLLPLVAVDPAGAMPSGGRAPVIVFTVDRQSFGLLVDSIPEVADAVPQERASRDSAGAVLLNGKAVEVIDPARYLDHAIRARVERRRPERKRGAASAESAAMPAAHDDLFVRKPTR